MSYVLSSVFPLLMPGGRGTRDILLKIGEYSTIGKAKRAASKSSLLWVEDDQFPGMWHAQKNSTMLTIIRTRDLFNRGEIS